MERDFCRECDPCERSGCDMAPVCECGHGEGHDIVGKENFEVVAQVRLILSADSAADAEDTATRILNDVVLDIEHIEVKS